MLIELFADAIAALFPRPNNDPPFRTIGRRGRAGSIPDGRPPRADAGGALDSRDAGEPAPDTFREKYLVAANARGDRETATGRSGYFPGNAVDVAAGPCPQP